MRFLYIKLTGYAGLYNGSGLDSIELDFTRCKNKITVISGPNGTGKSTIINALHLMPDGNHNFLEGREASKIIKLEYDGSIYDICITHPIDKNGNRATTRANVMKNGSELNTTGNVSQYKDIIFTEFDMDSNYMELFKISNDRRGMSDMTPGERKKFMSSLISSLDVYNNIYKNLNKKSNIFKSYINNLSSKIQSVGDEVNLRQALISLDNREKKTTALITETRDKIVELKTLIAAEDPDGTMNTEFDYIKSSLESVEMQLTALTNSISKDSLFDDVVKKREELESHNMNIIALTEKYAGIGSEITRCNNDIDKLKIRLEKLSGDIDDSCSKDMIDSYRDKISTIEDMFSKIGITDLDNISADEINHTIDIIQDIVFSIDNIMRDNDTDSVRDISNTYGTDIGLLLTKEEEELKQCNESRLSYLDTIRVMDNDKDIIDVLDNRPKTCKIDSCPFISKALSVSKKYKNYDKDRQSVVNALYETEESIAKHENTIEKYKNTISTNSQVQAVTKVIKSNSTLLRKFRITSRIIDEKLFLDALSEFYNFEELRHMGDYRNIANELTSYKHYKSVLSDLEIKYNKYLGNEKQINEINADISQLETDKQSLIDSQARINKEIDQEKELVRFLEANINITEKFNNLTQQKKELSEKKDKFEKKFANSIASLKMIEDLQIVLNNATPEISQIQNDRRNIESQLTLLDSYNREYEEYKIKYEFTDKLRKYSSPTSDSIQALFMSIYMDKTLQMVNQLLGMMFSGNYRILEYIINDSEFRIPFIGNGLAVDDISSGSTSQKCMMGMIINLVLSSISSGKYNIVSLDEIDGGLDDANRYMFVDVLQNISNILNFDQIFIISHSVESALNNVDVVLLSSDQTYVDQFGNANIIYQKG